MSVENMIGKTYGKLTIIKQYYKKTLTGEKRDYCDCECSCGNFKKGILGKNIRRGSTNSCGCLAENSIWEACHKTNEYYELDENSMVGVDYKGFEFYFSKNKYEIVKDYSWSVGKHGYAQTKGRKSKIAIFMHNLIMGTDEKRTVDHINRKRNDNRDENLRFITIQLNNINKEKASNNTSGVIGVSQVSKNNWHSYISNNGKRVNVYSETFFDAVVARLQLERDIYGDFAPQKHLFFEYGIEEN